MKEPIREYLFRLRKKRSRRRKLAAVLICLSLIVAGSTAWALHINGEGQTGETFCGCEEHQHTEECIEKTLVCGYDTEEAAEPETETLSEQISEPFSAGHTHTDACYKTQTVLTCTETEHTHSVENGCYDEEGNLICEISEHTHSEENGCYTTETVLVCGLEEGSAEAAEAETEAGTEASDGDETAVHVHTDECYEITYICGKEEHTHTLSCYSDPEADVETAAIWEQSVSGAELTGVYAEDLVAIAKTQLGYAESTDNYQVVLDAEGNETTETKGYTRYGAWYGDPYGDWCAMFVSFCLNYANVPETAFPRDASCPAWVEALSDPEQGYELYRAAAAGYFPYPGDVVFFDWDGDGSADHVGIVSGLTPEYTGTEEYYEDDPDYTLTGIVTIEGNFSDQVKTNTYDLDDSAILGYGALSLVYGTAAQADGYIEVNEATQVEKFKLWVYSATSGGSMLVNRGDGNEITDAFTYTDTDGAVYYLVPYTYFDKVKDQLEYFTFDEDNCPFVYAPSAYYPSANLTDAVYAKYNGSWYVRVQDTGSYDNNIPRSNIYYDVSKEVGDYFTLTYNGTELKVHVVDSSGKPIYGNYSDYNMTLEGAKKYLFEADDSDTTSTLITIPTVEDYTYSGTHLTSYSGVSVVSVVTFGYILSEDSNKPLANNFRFYNAAGGFYTRGSETVYLVYSPEMHIVTEVASANSTAVNLFDYWCTTRDGSDYHQSEDNAGINLDHALKFHYNSSDAVGTFNKWTGSGGGVLQGIVKKTLVNNFPSLSGDTSLGMASTDTESLDYLFDPSVTNDYKVSYRNVQGLFQLDSSGYYYYNSKENFAEFHEDTNRFILYEEAGVANSDTNEAGMFFPFNTIEEAYPLSSGENSTLNHYFGMALTTRFIQNYGGHTDSTKKVDTTFEFAGDDDVWIFIDNVLVADLGGIHDAASVTINFAKGTVEISEVYGQTTAPVTTYFSDIFRDTGVSLDENGTLAENTTHTLKFFYLERGNAASNLYLKYNLNEVPATAIYKVDQYGDPLANATFAVYASNENGEYLSDLNSTMVVDLTRTENDGWYVDLDTNSGTYGSILDKDGNLLIKALYLGTTDATGTMPFVDGDNMYYSLAELEGMFGKYFLLQEIDVPDGYRTVSDTVLLTIQNNLLQLAGSSYDTGVWTSPNAMVTATNTLYVANLEDYEKVKAETDGSISYYDISSASGSDTGTTKGSLFAVVLARGTRDATAYDQWTPVTGNDQDGYDYVYTPATDGGTYSNLADAIAAAKSYNENNNGLNHVFTYAASGMQVTVEELPGEPSQYYTYLETLPEGNEKTDAQYLVAYYYTTVDIATEGWEKVTTENTARVTSHAATDSANYQFTVQWGATIMVPNVENRLFVQKRDVENQPVNGAVFALYQVGEDENKITTNEDGTTTTTTYTMYYIADNGTHIYLGELGENNQGKAALSYDALSGDSAGTYRIAEDGVITVTIDGTTYTITPADTATTAEAIDEENTADQDGTGVFKTVSAGYYVVREVYVPAGYALNTAETKVLVNEDAVYANAGTSENGVMVGNGVGYLVSTLDTFATEGSIDETLTWIYSVLRVNTGYDSFSEFSLDHQVQYVQRADNDIAGMGTDTTTDRSEAMVTYLVYDPDIGYFDYRAALSQAKRKAEKDITYEDFDGNKQTVKLAENDTHKHIETLEGEGTQRLYSDEGWTALEVYQDYLLGQSLTANYTEYTDLEEQNIANLFSNSTFILYTDQYSVGDLEISKTVLPEDDTQGFNFTLTLSAGENMITTLAESYTYTVYDVTYDANGVETGRKEATTTNENGDYTGTITVTDNTGTAEITLKDKQIVVIENLPYGTEYTVQETLPESNTALPYTTWISVNKEGSVEDTETGDTLLWTEALNEDNVWRVDYTNALLPLVELVKVDSTNANTTLAGAKFVMYRVVAQIDATGAEVRDANGNTVTVTQYYSSADGKWQELSNGKNESDYAMTTITNGELLVANMNRAGTYYLKELAAPDGYDPLTEIVQFTVAEVDNKLQITSPTADSPTGIYTVTNLTDDGQQLNVNVKNNPGYELPATGGTGTTLFTLGGLLLMAATFVYGCGRRRRRERRND